jgi:Putative zinc-finger
MPDTTSPKVTMADEDFGRETDRTMPRRRWNCPGDLMIAAYADGTLGQLKKSWVEFHLAGCQRCRLLVAEVIKAQRETDLPLPPLKLKWKAISLAERKPASQRWVWAPAGVLAAIALLAVFSVMLRKPERLIVVAPPAPSAPLIAKAEPAATHSAPVREIERKRASLQLFPSVILPQPDSVVRRERLEFGWKPILHSRYYEVRIVTSDGDLVWEGQTEKSDLQPPSDVAMRDGSYFVWITAYLADGRVAKSPPVKFLIRR